MEGGNGWEKPPTTNVFWEVPRPPALAGDGTLLCRVPGLRPHPALPAHPWR